MIGELIRPPVTDADPLLITRAAMFVDWDNKVPPVTVVMLADP